MSCKIHNNIKPKYDTLVFEGGAARGISYVGALKSLHERKITQKITHFAGTSVGGMFAAMLSIGYSGMDLFQMRHRVKFSISKPFQCGCCCCCSWFCRMFCNYGYYSYDTIESTLRELISERDINPDISLKKLFITTKKNLTLVTTNLDRKTVEYLNHTTHPELSLINALKMTSAVPYVFGKMEINGNHYCDGGISDNYPIHIANTGSSKIIPSNVLGLRIFVDGETNDEKIHEKKDSDITSLKDYSAAIMETVMYRIEELAMNESVAKQTIAIHIPNDDSVPSADDLNPTPLQIEAITTCGEDAVNKYFQN